MVALEFPLIAAVVTMKFADVAAACTVTDGATLSAVLVFERVTLAPPAGAAWVSVTVQVPEEFAPMLAGLQLSDETRTLATRFTVALAELLLKVAVMVALELLAMAAVDTVKLANVVAAATVTDEATVSLELVLERVTPAPPAGAGWVSVTVQAPEEFAPMLAGLHVSDETSTEPVRLTVVWAEAPL